jgi:O-antigen/teichoic acid export membrane protein
MDFGITRLLIAEIARRRDESDLLLGNGLTLGLIVGLPVLAVMALAANLPVFQHTPLIVHSIYMMGIGALLYTTSASLRSAFRAFNRFEYEAIISILTAVVLVGSAFLVLYFDLPFVLLFAAFAVAQLSALSWAWWTYNKHFGRVKLSYNLSFIRQLLRKTWAFTLVGLLTRAFTRVDIIILRFFQGASTAGYYALATTIFYQMNTIAQLVSTAMLPTMAQTYVKQPDNVGRQLDAAVRLQVLVGLPSTIFGVMMAPQIIGFLYGPGYEDSALIFRLLVMVVALRFVNQTLGVTLTAMDQQRKRAAMLGLTVFFNIAINFLLIPRWSFIGATVTAIMSEIVLFVLTYFVLGSPVRTRIAWSSLVRPLIGTLTMVPILYLMRNWSLLVTLPLSAIAFIMILFLFRTFSPGESKAIVVAIESLDPIPAPIKQHLADFVIRRARDRAGVPSS